MRSISLRLSSCSLAFAMAAGLAAPAAAHPHVWVEVKTEIVYANGSFTGIRQVWTFDELYTAQAIEGLDANKDGRLDRVELDELAKVNMEGLKEFGYFTHATLGGQKLAFMAPTEAFLEHVEVAAPPGPKPVAIEGVTPAAKAGADAAAAPAGATRADAGQPGFWSRVWSSVLGQPPQPSAGEARPKVLALTFNLPFAQPVLADAPGFEVATYDPSFFIWLDLAANGAKLSQGAPDECQIKLGEASSSGQEAQRLGEAFFNQMGGAAFGANAARTLTARCARS